MKNKLTNMHPDDLIHNTRVYARYISSGMGIDGWGQSDKAYNFSIMATIADKAESSLEGASILDVGCGTGDLSFFLRKKHILHYLGVDINQTSLAKAKEKYPTENFMFADILAGELKESFDFVFCSGALSIRLKNADNYLFLTSMIEAMWDMADIGLVFNFLTDEDEDPDDDLFYYSEEAVIEICRHIAPTAQISIQKTPIPSEGRPDNAQSHIFVVRK